MDVILRKEAKRLGLTHYFTGKKCRNGHLEPRFVKGGRCMQCARDAAKRQAKENSHKIKTRLAAWRANNKEHICEYNTSYWNNVVKIDQDKLSRRRDAARNYNEKPEIKKRKREYDKLYSPLWVRNNKDRCAATSAKRRFQKLQATPCWLTDEDHAAILQVYRTAQRRTAETGKLFVVDHIIPLKGKLICGLHVPWNLQILTDIENKSKGTKLISDCA